MRPMASGHEASSSPPPPLPTCVVPLNELSLFLWGVSKEGVPSHGTNLGFKKGEMDLDARNAPFPSYWNLVFYSRALSHTESPGAFHSNRCVESSGNLSVQVGRTLPQCRVMYLDSPLFSFLPRCRAWHPDSLLFS